ncbi:FANCI helical domain 2 [Popillia japonica]|uniref:FANCI helical domain 2 n=1 Tax=Popillia japonica TaxID=7064 RepID=A0AAW1KK32_POPJA
MLEIEKQIRAYGQTRNTADLQSYVADLDVEEITLVIKKRISYAEFSTFWNYLLQALDTDDLQEKRYEIVQSCINEIKERNINTPHVNSLVTRLWMELPKFLTKHLISLCTLCMGFIQKGDVTEACWKELLPEVLNIIKEKECVECNLNEMSGLEYKAQYVNSLCMLDWSSNIIIPLTMMFIEMPLSQEEHFQVTCKLVSYMERLTAQEIPPFVYQVLRFCQNQNSKLVFPKLQEYFDLRIYSCALSNGSSDEIISDSMDVEAIEAESTVLYHIYQSALSANHEAIEAESTVLYHIYQSALSANHSIKDYLSSLKNFIKSPEFILHPFQLNVLLSLSTISCCEDKVFDLIRQTIARSFREDMKKSECHWLRDLAPATLDLEDSLIRITCNIGFRRFSHKNYTEQFKRKRFSRESLIVKKQWNLGKFVLLHLVKEKHHIAHVILQKLCDLIIMGNSVTQYIDCFRDFSLKFTFITLENKSCIVQLMEALVSVPEHCAETILDTVLPLIKISPTLRDHLFLLLRKALFSRSTETRQVGVRGFLKVLTKLKIQNLTALSQINSSSSSSSHSVLTQISLHRSGHNSQTNVFSNEALCLEVLNILKRCYMRQADIRAKLYGGLNDAVNHNPELALPVLNVLWVQFLKYYNVDEDVLPPIDFSKITVVKDTDVIVQEPIAQLVSAINFLIIKVQTLEDEDTNAEKFIEVMESLCRRLIKCELIHFELDDGTDLTDILPECKKKVATLREAMSLYECLIGYKILSWNKSSQSHAQQIIALYQGLKYVTKNASKTKQKIDKKKKDLGKTTQTARTVQRSQTSQQNRTTQVQSQVSEHQNQNDRESENMRGAKAVLIKLPNTVLNIKILMKCLSLLHENVNWTTVQQANLLKVKHDIHQHIMQATVFQLQQISTHKCLERNKEYYTQCRDIAKIIYPKSTLAVECFDTIVNIVCTHYNGELKSFLCVVGIQDSDNSYLTCLTPFIEKYQTLFELDDNTLDDQEFKRMLEIIGIG